MMVRITMKLSLHKVLLVSITFAKTVMITKIEFSLIKISFSSFILILGWKNVINAESYNLKII